MGFMIPKVFYNILDKSRCKPNKIWVDKGNQFYNRSMKPWLQDNGIKIYQLNIQSREICYC